MQSPSKDVAQNRVVANSFTCMYTSLWVTEVSRGWKLFISWKHSLHIIKLLQELYHAFHLLRHCMVDGGVILLYIMLDEQHLLESNPRSQSEKEVSRKIMVLSCSIILSEHFR